jgi:hypothetical protein
LPYTGLTSSPILTDFYKSVKLNKFYSVSECFQEWGAHFFKKPIPGQTQWHTTINPAFQRLRQEDHQFKANLGYIVRPCMKKQTTKKPIPTLF